VKEIEQEAYGEHGMATDEDPKQTVAVDLSKRLKDLRAGNDGSSQKVFFPSPLLSLLLFAIFRQNIVWIILFVLCNICGRNRV
jgi:hypothetical protein